MRAGAAAAELLPTPHVVDGQALLAGRALGDGLDGVVTVGAASSRTLDLDLLHADALVSLAIGNLSPGAKLPAPGGFMTRAALLALSLLASGCAVVNSTRAEGAPEIAWQTWSAAAFARAKREDKPILVNVGTQWCHWCHVMDDVTYADPRVRRLIAERYVAIRADAEERPELGERYFNDGWPANVVLSPQGERVLSRPGYWSPDRFLPALRRVVAQLDAGTLRPETRTPAQPAAKSLAEARAKVEAELDRAYDEEHQGWGKGKIKFPWFEALERELRRAWRVPSEAERGQRALRTLLEVEQLLDPVAGGLFQYSDNGAWSSPHYERVMKTQAGVLEAYALAYAQTGGERWRRAASQIARHLTGPLRDPESGFFYASQDADPPPSALEAGLSAEDYYALDAAGRARYMGQPRIDTHRYAEHNGRALAALARLATVKGDTSMLAELSRTARELLRFAERRPGAALRVPHRLKGEKQPLTHLADQVEVARALLWLHVGTSDPTQLEAAFALARGFVAELSDPEGGGFFAHSRDASLAGPLLDRQKPFAENARAALLLLELAAVGGDPSWRTIANRALLAIVTTEELKERAGSLGGALLALDAAVDGVVAISVSGPLEQSQTQALLRAAREVAGGAALVHHVPGGSPRAFVCRGETCSLPTRDPARLAKLLEDFARPGN